MLLIELRSLSLKRPDSAGYILLTVLGVILLLTLIGLALLTYVWSALGLTRAAIENADTMRAIDGAMETALQQARGNLGSCPAVAVTQSGVTAECVFETNPPVQGPVSDSRIIDITAEKNSQLIGRARVRVTDLVAFEDTTKVPPVREMAEGYAVEVCDWQIGARQVAEGLKGCT